MNRRIFRKCARWLLPLMVARAFLPVGFMLATQADGLHLAFCPGQAPIVQGLDHAATGHAGHVAGGHGGSQHSGHLDPPCPFAVVAVAAVIDVPHLATVALQAAEVRWQVDHELTSAPSIVRAQSPRAPPSTSLG